MNVFKDSFLMKIMRWLLSRFERIQKSFFGTFRDRAFREVLRDNVPFFVVALVVIGFMFGLLADFSGRGSECKKITNDTEQYFCYLNSSVVHQDIEICDRIGASDERNGCRVYFAIQTRNFASCDFVARNEQRQFCYANVAFAKRDDEECGKVMHVEYRDECYERLALVERNESLCMPMSTPDLRVQCVSMVQKAIVAQKKSSS